MNNSKKPSEPVEEERWAKIEKEVQELKRSRSMENVVRGSQSYLTSAIDSLTIVAKGYPFYAALMDSLLDGLPAKKKEE